MSKNFKLGERVFVNCSGIAGFVGSNWAGSEGVVTKETNHRGHVKIRLDNAPKILKYIHDNQDGLWCYQNKVFFVTNNLKVGDEVFVGRNGVIGGNSAVWEGSKGTVTSEVNPTNKAICVKLNRVPHGFSDMHDSMNGLWCAAKSVYAVERDEPTRKKNEIPSPCELRLSFAGNATTMSLVDNDGKVTCSATARCHPDDDFSVAEGMAIAFERLYQKYRKQNPDHSAIMIGDKVRLIKGAAFPLITSYGNTEKPSEIVLNEVGTVTSLSPNSVNAIVEWRENVVAAVATAGLEIMRKPKAEPKFREGDILVTKKNGCYVRVTKNYYEWEERVPFETAYEVCGELTPDSFIGKLDDNNRVDVGDVVEAQEEGIRYRGMIVAVTPRKNCPWIRDVLIKGVADGNTPVQKLIREDFTKPLHDREPFVGETVFVLSTGVKHDYGLTWYNDEAVVNDGRFCVVRGWYTNSSSGKRYAVVEHSDGKANVDSDYILLPDC